MGKFLSGAWGFWNNRIANILTLWGGILPAFLGVFAHKAHAINPDANLADSLYGFYQPLIETPEIILPGIGYFLGDVFDVAVALTTDFIVPGASIAFNAISEAMAGEVVAEVVADAVAPALTQ